MKILTVIAFFSLLFFSVAVLGQEEERTWDQRRADDLTGGIGKSPSLSEARQIAAADYAEERLKVSSGDAGSDIGIIFKSFGNLILSINQERQQAFSALLKYIDNAFLTSLLDKAIKEDVDARYEVARLVIGEPRTVNIINQHNGFKNYTYDSAVRDLTKLSLNGHARALFTIANELYQKYGTTPNVETMIKTAAGWQNFEAVRFLVNDKIFVFNNPLEVRVAANGKRKYILSKDQKKEIIYKRDSVLKYILSTGDWTAYYHINLHNPVLFSYDDKNSFTEQAFKHPLFKMAQIYTDQGVFNRPINLNEYAYLFKQIIEEKKSGTSAFSQYPVWVEEKILGDIYSSEYPIFNTTANLDSAYVWYEKAAKDGSMEALGILGKWLKEGKGYKKNPDVAFAFLSRSFKEGNLKVSDDLAECYEFGIGTKKDTSIAILLYKIGMQNGEFASSVCGMKRINDNLLKNTSPFTENLNASEIKRLISLDTNTIKVIHFWTSGPYEESYKTMVELCKYIQSKPKGVSFYLGSVTQNDEIIPDAFGYTGVIFGVGFSANRNFKLAEIYKKFYIAKFGVEQPPSELIAKTGFTVFPEFDSRWSQTALPATFVYIKGQPAPFYFDEKANLADIMKLIRQYTAK